MYSMFTISQQLTEAMSTLGQAGQDSNDQLDQKLAEVVSKMNETLQHVQEFEPVLAEVDSTLG